MRKIKEDIDKIDAFTKMKRVRLYKEYYKDPDPEKLKIAEEKYLKIFKKGVLIEKYLIF